METITEQVQGMDNKERLEFIKEKIKTFENTIKLIEENKQSEVLIKTGKNTFALSRDYTKLNEQTNLKRLKR